LTAPISHLTNFDIFEIYRKTQNMAFLEQTVDENWLEKNEWFFGF